MNDCWDNHTRSPIEDILEFKETLSKDLGYVATSQLLEQKLKEIESFIRQRKDNS